jgi:hypothetical protein
MMAPFPIRKIFLVWGWLRIYSLALRGQGP